MTEIGNHMWILLLPIHVYPFRWGGYFWAILILISKSRNQKLGISGAWGSKAISKLRKMMMNHDKPWLTAVFGVLSFLYNVFDRFNHLKSIVAHCLSALQDGQRIELLGKMRFLFPFAGVRLQWNTSRVWKVTSDVNLTIGLNSGGVMWEKSIVIFMDTIQHF